MIALGILKASPRAHAREEEAQDLAWHEQLNITVSRAAGMVINWGRDLWLSLLSIGQATATSSPPVTHREDTIRHIESFPRSRAPRPVAWSTPVSATRVSPDLIPNIPGAYQASPPSPAVVLSQGPPVMSDSPYSPVRDTLKSSRPSTTPVRNLTQTVQHSTFITPPILAHDPTPPPLPIAPISEPRSTTIDPTTGLFIYSRSTVTPIRTRRSALGGFGFRTRLRRMEIADRLLANRRRRMYQHMRQVWLTDIYNPYLRRRDRAEFEAQRERVGLSVREFGARWVEAQNVRGVGGRRL